MKDYYLIKGVEKQGIKDLFDVFAVINEVYFKLNWGKTRRVCVAKDITKLDYLKKALKYAYRAGYKKNANRDTDFSKSADCLLRAGFTTFKESDCLYICCEKVSKLYQICIAMKSSHPDNEVGIGKVWNCICRVVLCII